MDFPRKRVVLIRRIATENIAEFEGFGVNFTIRAVNDFQPQCIVVISRLGIEKLNWPDGVTLPDKLEGEDTGTSFQVGYGDTRASNLWEYSWMKEWLNSYSTDSARAEKALEELEKAFDMPYMGTDRCDDATRNYLRENIDKAKLGDPSGFRECIELNYE